MRNMVSIPFTGLVLFKVFTHLYRYGGGHLVSIPFTGLVLFKE